MKCPICGEEDTLEISSLYQYSKNYKITKDGHVAKKYRKEDNLTMEVDILICKNGCNVNDLEWFWDSRTRELTILGEKRFLWK